MNDSPLIQAIREHNPAPMTDADAQAAARNLAGFFSLLIDIDREQADGSPEGRGAK